MERQQNCTGACPPADLASSESSPRTDISEPDRLFFHISPGVGGPIRSRVDLRVAAQRTQVEEELEPESPLETGP